MMPDNGTAGFERALTTEVYSSAWNYASRLCPVREEAEDLLMDAISQGMARYGQLRDRGAFRGWLLSIIRTTFIDRLRREKRRGEILSELTRFETDHSTDPLAEEMVLGLQRLSEEHREILILFYLEDHSLREVARILKLTDAAVRQKLYRARLALGDVLKQAGLKTTPQIPGEKAHGSAGSNEDG